MASKAEVTAKQVAAGGGKKDRPDSGWGNKVRAAAICLLIAIGCLAFGSYIIVHWAEQQVLTTDNWVALVGPLPQQPVVSQALGNYITDQVFENVAVQQLIADALPPKAAFLAAPLAGQLHGLTASASQKLVASDTFQAIWIAANRIALNRIVMTARGQTPPLQAKINEKFNINISDAAGKLRSALGDASQAIPALQPAAHKAIGIAADLHARRQRVRQFIQTADLLAAVLPLLITASFLGALAVAWQRRRTALLVTVSIVILCLAELIAINWSRQETLGLIRNQDNLPAIGYIFDTIDGGLKQMIYSVIALTVIIAVLLIAAGPAKWAVSLRSFVHMEQLRQSRPMRRWRDARLWVRSKEHYIWIGLTVAVLIGAALSMNVSGRFAANCLLLLLSLIALTHIIATPHQTPHPTDSSR